MGMSGGYGLLEASGMDLRLQALFFMGLLFHCWVRWGRLAFAPVPSLMAIRPTGPASARFPDQGVFQMSSGSKSRGRSAGRERSQPSVKVQGGSFFGSFWADFKDVLSRYSKRTSRPHKQLVLVLILGGGAMRAWMLLQPITADEAFLWVHYASHPVGIIISDMSHPQNQVLHTLLVKASAAIFGIDKVSIRLPAFLAGLLSLPVYYLVVRAMFNRYIAVMALALAASSGMLIEYGALANGQAMVWLFTLLAMAFGRHFHKTNNVLSAAGMGVMVALAMWTATSALYPALMVLLWSLFHLLFNHSDSLPSRIAHWSVGFLLFFVLTLVLYAPVINQHGLLQLFHHDRLPDHTWRKFKSVHPEGGMLLWAYIVDTSGRFFALAGLLGVVVAAYISVKYRTLAFAMLLGAVIPVLLVHYVPAPPAWSYTLFILHISSALVLFYLLKYIQEKAMPKLGKRTRVAVASLVLMVASGWPAMAFLLQTDRIPRFAEAEEVAHFYRGAMEPTDRILADEPWEDPLIFHLMTEGLGAGVASGIAAPGSLVYVVVDPGTSQTVASVLADHGSSLDDIQAPQLVKEALRLKIYAALVR